MLHAHLLIISVTQLRGVLLEVETKFLNIIGIKFRVFRDVAPCSRVEADRRFTGAYCLHHQGGE